MKLYVRLAEMSDIEYLKSNNMYQTALKYINIFKESGLFERYPWTKEVNGVKRTFPVTAIVFRQVDDDDDDYELAGSYHQYNSDEYIRLPYGTDKDIALVRVDDSRLGELSFIFHDNGVGEYNEIRFLSGDWTRGKPVCIGEF